MSKWFWIWLRSARRAEEREASKQYENCDWDLIEGLISALCDKRMPKGDGRASRIERYVTNVLENVEFCRMNWKGQDDVLTGFFKGVDATITEFARIIGEVKKG